MKLSEVLSVGAGSLLNCPVEAWKDKRLKPEFFSGLDIKRTRGTGRSSGPSRLEEQELMLSSGLCGSHMLLSFSFHWTLSPGGKDLFPVLFAAGSSGLEQQRCVRCVGLEQTPGTPPPCSSLPCFGVQPETGTISSKAPS